MVYEKISLAIDIEKLRRHLEDKVIHLPPVMLNKFWGGWSVTSATGLYTDGWYADVDLWKVEGGVVVFNAEKAEEKGIVVGAPHVKPTEICIGYMAEVVAKIAALGLNPERVRIMVLKAGGFSSWHSDKKPETYAVRLHIPIITNTGSIFECEDGTAHFPADGDAYVIKVNRPHRIFNSGFKDRFHLMMDIKDTSGATKWHNF